MEEDRKDQIEDIGVAVAEAALSLIPIVGGPAAVIANRALGSAVQRRQARILEELRDDLTRLERSGLVVFDGQLAESELFQAALQRTIRQLLESDSDYKRTLLRNALLSRLAGTDDPDRFNDALERVRPRDAIWLSLQAESPSVAQRDAMFQFRADEDRRRYDERRHRMITAGLVIDTSRTELDMSGIEHGTAPHERKVGGISVTPFGRDFLAYVSDPTASPTPAPPGDPAPR